MVPALCLMFSMTLAESLSLSKSEEQDAPCRSCTDISGFLAGDARLKHSREQKS